MLAVLHDETADPDRRDRMAVAAAPFVHPRLQVVDARVVAKVETPQQTEEERRAEARRLIAEAFAERPRLTVEGEYKVFAGKEVPTASVQANSEADNEREG